MRCHFPDAKGSAMLSLTMIFLILTSLAGMALVVSTGETAWIARSLFILFGALFLLSFAASVAR